MPRLGPRGPQVCLKSDANPSPTTVRVYRCGYVSRCRVRRCLKRATSIEEKVDAAGRHVRQIELCEPHLNFVLERERGRGLEVQDRRGGYEERTPRNFSESQVAPTAGVCSLR